MTEQGWCMHTETRTDEETHTKSQILPAFSQSTSPGNREITSSDTDECEACTVSSFLFHLGLFAIGKYALNEVCMLSMRISTAPNRCKSSRTTSSICCLSTRCLLERLRVLFCRRGACCARWARDSILFHLHRPLSQELRVRALLLGLQCRCRAYFSRVHDASSTHRESRARFGRDRGTGFSSEMSSPRRVLCHTWKSGNSAIGAK